MKCQSKLERFTEGLAANSKVIKINVSEGAIMQTTKTEQTYRGIAYNNNALYEVHCISL